MKKSVLITLMMVVMLISVFTITSWSNKQLFDTTYNFDRAIIELPNGEVIEGEVDSWKDYEGDQLQIKIDGTTYLAHSSKVAMIND